MEQKDDQLTAVRGVLRALAGVRDGAFYRLWVDLTAIADRPLPDLTFRIFQIADSDDAIATLGVGMMRSDGAEVCWSLSVATTPQGLVVTGSVELTTDAGVEEVHRISHTASEPARAGELIRACADAVCRERAWARSTRR